MTRHATVPAVPTMTAITAITTVTVTTIIAIIAMTANAFFNDVRDCLASGMNAHLAKPIDIDELKIILLKYIKYSEN
jgi:CheY-like chemotaxis protein